MREITTKMNGYRTPEMIANDIEHHGQCIGIIQKDAFQKKYFICDVGSFKSGVEITYLNGKAVSTRRLPVDQLHVLVNKQIG